MIAAPVTIRTRLYRRKRGYVALYSVCMLGVVFAVTLGELGHDAWFGVALVLLASMLWAWHGSVARVRCPRCGGNIGHLGLHALTGYPFWSKPIVYCPYCKAEMDAPADAGASAGNNPR